VPGVVRPHRTARSAADLRLGDDVADALRAQLPAVAEQTVAAITVEVPSYADAFGGPMGTNISNAVEMALGGFLRLASQPARAADPSTPLRPALEAAYALGRGEARSGRSMDALLAAYRVGARVAWRELSGAAVSSGLPADRVARFAELVFAYIDELSAASVAGHTDELDTSGQVRRRLLERLAHHLVQGSPAEAVQTAAERAGWTAPRTLTAVVVPEAQVRPVLGAVSPGTLQSGDDLPGLDNRVLLLVPDMDGRRRAALLGALRDRNGIAGPARPWLSVRVSVERVLRALDLGITVDTEEHLAHFVLTADREAVADLRARALAPLADLRPASAEKLTDTLRSWLLHHGRRDDVAAELFVHPQTVRYRMSQLRELFGDRLDDPASVLELTIALAGEPAG
jgi:hypothetical protein